MIAANPEILRLRRLINRHQEKIRLIQNTCDHTKVYYDYGSGYDYERTTHVCTKCGEFFTVFKSV